mgnify:CR=1 FL=1
MDWTRAAADLAAILVDNAQSIVVRRGNTTLPAQSVRIARIANQGVVRNGEVTQESRGRAVVLGSTYLDIRPDDRFTDAHGVLYRVVLVRPNRRAAVIAEAEVVE